MLYGARRSFGMRFQEVSAFVRHPLGDIRADNKQLIKKLFLGSQEVYISEVWQRCQPGRHYVAAVASNGEGWVAGKSELLESLRKGDVNKNK